MDLDLAEASSKVQIDLTAVHWDTSEADFVANRFVRHGCKLENAGLLRKVRCRHGVCFQVGLSFFKKFATAL